MEYAFNTRAAILPDEPKTFREAMSGPNADKWYKAAQDEIQSHLDNGTWILTTLVPRQKGHWQQMGVQNQKMLNPGR